MTCGGVHGGVHADMDIFHEPKLRAVCTALRPASHRMYGIAWTLRTLLDSGRDVYNFRELAVTHSHGIRAVFTIPARAFPAALFQFHSTLSHTYHYLVRSFKNKYARVLLDQLTPAPSLLQLRDDDEVDAQRRQLEWRVRCV